MVAHAAEQDLEVLQIACGRGPSRLFDTQVAAGFLGFGSASLATLTSNFLGIEVGKADRLTDWSARPLTDAQVQYARADVAHLIALADVLIAQLNEKGRLAWAEEECDALRGRTRTESDPEKAWWRLREARSLKGASRGVAQEVAAWRENLARRQNRPVRQVLPDLALLAIAYRPPSTPAELRATRGMEGRHLGKEAEQELLDAAARGRKVDPARLSLPPTEEVSREQRAPVALAMAWLAQLARDEQLDPTVLATRADLVAWMRGDKNSRLASGWRAELAGRELRELFAGRASLALDGKGSLVLEARSGEPLR